MPYYTCSVHSQIENTDNNIKLEISFNFRLTFNQESDFVAGLGWGLYTCFVVVDVSGVGLSSKR